jgi:hypothetical protein
VHLLRFESAHGNIVYGVMLEGVCGALTNKERQRPVPEVVLEYQKSVEQDEGYFNSLNDISDHVLNLDTEGALSECIMKIEETLQLMHNE